MRRIPCRLRCPRIFRAVETGSSIRHAAARFEVSPSAAVKSDAAGEKDGQLLACRYGGYRRPLLEPHKILVRSIVAAAPDITLAEIQAALRAVGALSTIHHTLRRIGLRHKKSP